MLPLTDLQEIPDASLAGLPSRRVREGPPGGLNSPLLLVLVQILVLVGLVRLAWLGMRWLWRRVLRRERCRSA